MDRLIYTAMTGAKHLLEQQAVVAHNLANANTTGFRAELSAFRAVPLVGDGLNTRAFVVGSTVGADLSVIFDTPVEQRYAKALMLLGLEAWMLSPEAGHA